ARTWWRRGHHLSLALVLASKSSDDEIARSDRGVALPVGLHVDQHLPAAYLDDRGQGVALHTIKQRAPKIVALRDAAAEEHGTAAVQEEAVYQIGQVIGVANTLQLDLPEVGDVGIAARRLQFPRASHHVPLLPLAGPIELDVLGVESHHLTCLSASHEDRGTGISHVHRARAVHVSHALHSLEGIVHQLAFAIEDPECFVRADGHAVDPVPAYPELAQPTLTLHPLEVDPLLLAVYRDVHEPIGIAGGDP